MNVPEQYRVEVFALINDIVKNARSYVEAVADLMTISDPNDFEVTFDKKFVGIMIPIDKYNKLNQSREQFALFFSNLPQRINKL